MDVNKIAHFSRKKTIFLKAKWYFVVKIKTFGTFVYISMFVVIFWIFGYVKWRIWKKKLTLSAAPPGKIFLTTAPLFLEPLIPKPNPFPSFVNTITWIWAQSHWSCGTNEIFVTSTSQFILSLFSTYHHGLKTGPRCRVAALEQLPPTLHSRLWT